MIENAKILLKLVVAGIISFFAAGFAIFLIPTLLIIPLHYFFGCNFEKNGQGLVGANQICTSPTTGGFVGLVTIIGISAAFLTTFVIIYKNFKVGK